LKYAETETGGSFPPLPGSPGNSPWEGIKCWESAGAECPSSLEGCQGVEGVVALRVGTPAARELGLENWGGVQKASFQMIEGHMKSAEFPGG
jgi:hypothetical protein